MTEQERLHQRILADMLRRTAPGEASHADLYAARRYARTPEQQNDLAVAEHAAFAREASEENPLMMLPIMAATPLYTASKALGLSNARSKPSFEEIGAGWHGAWTGGLRGLKRKLGFNPD